MWSDLLYGLRAVVQRNTVDAEMNEELSLHVDLETEKLIRSGLTPREASRRARLRFGSPDAIRETCRDARGTAAIDGAIQDLGYAARTLKRCPRFTIPAVGVLALALGAGAVMFGVVDAVLLEPLPYRSPDELAMLWTSAPDQNDQGRPDWPTFEAWRNRSRTFVDMAAMDPVSVTLDGDGGAIKGTVARISPNFFSVLGVTPASGRVFSEAEMDRRERVAVISHRFWQSRFAGRSDALGRSIEVDGIPSRIIGILPDGFGLGFGADAFEPASLFPDWDTRRTDPGAGSWLVVGRLRTDRTVAEAQTEMTAIAGDLASERPLADRDATVRVVGLEGQIVDPRSRLALMTVSGAVALILLIAIANVLGLTLARGVDRAPELGVRVALGAGGARIARQLIVEGLLLALVAGVAASVIASVGIDLVRTFGPASLARLDQVDLSLAGFAWIFAAALGSGVGIGAASSWAVMKGPSRSGPAGARLIGSAAAVAFRRGVVAAEFALAVVLLAGGGLLVRSWIEVSGVDPGFSPDRILSVNMTTNAAIGNEGRARYYREVIENVEALPGVETAAVIGDLWTGDGADVSITVERDARPEPMRLRVRIDEASPEIFATLGTPLVGGRVFGPGDGPDAPPVAVVNETLSGRLWGGRDPVGERFRFGAADAGGAWVTVVGVVGDMRRRGIETAPDPQIFFPVAQRPSGNAILLARTASEDPLALADDVRTAIWRLEPGVPLYSVTTLEGQIDGMLEGRRVQTVLVAVLAAFAILLSGVGLYGLIQYAVSTRSREIGIRIAVGAVRGDIVRMVAGEGVRLGVIGLALGLPGAVAAGRLVRGLLYGVGATDPVTFLAVGVLLLAIAAAASIVPARRAAATDPAAALRSD